MEIDDNGYPRGNLKHSDLIHRQVAYREIYLKNRDKYPLPFSKYQVHHKNGDKKDYRVSNLLLVTEEEHRKIHGLPSKNSSLDNYSEDPAKAYHEYMTGNKVHPSLKSSHYERVEDIDKWYERTNPKNNNPSSFIIRFLLLFVTFIIIDKLNFYYWHISSILLESLIVVSIAELSRYVLFKGKVSLGKFVLFFVALVICLFIGMVFSLIGKIFGIGILTNYYLLSGISCLLTTLINKIFD